MITTTTDKSFTIHYNNGKSVWYSLKSKTYKIKIEIKKSILLVYKVTGELFKSQEIMTMANMENVARIGFEV